MIFLLPLLAGCPPEEGPKTVMLDCDACEADCLSDIVESTSAEHVEGDLDYPDSPPSSGDHSRCWAEWGVHTDDEVPPENWVHNLEHGGVAFLYQTSVGYEAEVAELATYVGGLPHGRALLTAYPDMEWAFAVVSWEHRVRLSCYDLPTMKAFYTANVGHGPEDSLDDPTEDCWGI